MPVATDVRASLYAGAALGLLRKRWRICASVCSSLTLGLSLPFGVPLIDGLHQPCALYHCLGGRCKSEGQLSVWRRGAEPLLPKPIRHENQIKVGNSLRVQGINELGLGFVFPDV